jgi:ABC-type Zn uptake system ZnuABC Zn-binding protein ZnuA
MHIARNALACLVAVTALLGVASSALGIDIVATTTLVGDTVRMIAGDDANLVTLLPENADPHAFSPTPSDVAILSDADVVFLSGADLEADLADLLTNAGGLVVDLSARVALREATSHGHDHEGEEADHGGEHSHGEYDPHVWFDPTNVMIWSSVIEQTLSGLDPQNAAGYADRAAAYRRALADLDLWIWDRIGGLPDDRRNLVTDHLAFGYFAARYGLRQVGSIFPGISTLAEPSAREIADLINSIESLAVPAIFVGTTVNPALAESIAADTGTQVIPLYTGSLSGPSGPAATYIEFMRYNTEAIVNALMP